MTKPAGAPSGQKHLSDFIYSHVDFSDALFEAELYIENTTGTQQTVALYVAYVLAGSSKTSFVYNAVNPPFTPGNTVVIPASSTVYVRETWTDISGFPEKGDVATWILGVSQPVGAGLFNYTEIDFNIRDVIR